MESCYQHNSILVRSGKKLQPSLFNTTHATKLDHSRFTRVGRQAVTLGYDYSDVPMRHQCAAAHPLTSHSRFRILIFQPEDAHSVRIFDYSKFHLIRLFSIPLWDRDVICARQILGNQTDSNAHPRFIDHCQHHEVPIICPQQE